MMRRVYLGKDNGKMWFAMKYVHEDFGEVHIMTLPAYMLTIKDDYEPIKLPRAGGDPDDRPDRDAR